MQTYHRVQIFRFYLKCTNVLADLIVTIDPQNSDYVVKFGTTHNFEPWRAEYDEADREKKKRNTEELGDAMKALQSRTLDSKKELDILATLDKMKSIKVCFYFEFS